MSDNKIVFDTISENKVQSVDYKKGLKLNCNLQIAFIYPTSCKDLSKLKNLQKLFVEKVFPAQYATMEAKEALANFSAQYILNFKSLKMDSFFDEDYPLDDENVFAYELNLKNEIVYNQNQFISFIVINDNYEGGAHGSNGIYGYVINLNTGEILSEDDFAGDNYKKNLASIIAQKIAKENGLDDVKKLENIGYNNIEEIAPNGNFVIDDKGITYYFNEYEIAAYFVGITKVFIPYEELKAYIAPESPISLLAGLK